MQRTDTPKRIEAQEIPQRDSFQYPNLIISTSREIEEDIRHKIKVRWLNWRFVSGVLWIGAFQHYRRENFTE